MMIKIFLFFGILLFLSTIFFGFKEALNASLSYFCSSFIIQISYKIYKNKILIESDEYIDDKKTFNLIFFAPIKILSYIVLILILFTLTKFKIFDPIFFSIGVLFMILVSILFVKTNLKTFFAKF